MSAPKMFAHHWIGGEWVDSDKRRESIDPATGETIGTYTEAGEAEATRAIAAALKAFRETDWRKNRPLRAKVLNYMADRFEARADDLIEILTLENGKVKPEAQFELSMETSPGRAARTMIDSPDVPVISFTGSSGTGRAIMAACAKNMKRFGGELGGKTPVLLFDDATWTKRCPKSRRRSPSSPDSSA